jgi:hypothetical protein
VGAEVGGLEGSDGLREAIAATSPFDSATFRSGQIEVPKSQNLFPRNPRLGSI